MFFSMYSADLVQKCFEKLCRLRVCKELCDHLRICSGCSGVVPLCGGRKFFVIVKDIFKELCIGPPVIVQNVGILVCDHLCLCVSRVALDGFDISSVQFQLIGDA